MRTATIINLQMFINERSNKLVNRTKLVAYMNEHDVNPEKWYYNLLTLHSFQVDTEIKMLSQVDIWEKIK